MKTGYFLFLAILFLSFGQVSSQELIYGPIQDKLTEDQRDDLDKASRAIDRTSSYISKAEAIEQKYSKFKNSKKKRHQKKYEKKTWEAKKYRVNAESCRQKSYQAAIDVYTEFLQSVEFYYSEDEEEVNRLIESAAGKIESADKTIGFYDEAESKGDFKKGVKYGKLSSDISKTRRLQEEAYSDLTKAMDIYLAQEAKKAGDEADENAWRAAKQTHTIAGYESYIGDFPQGKYVGEARKRIADLREKARLEAEKLKNQPTSDYTFSVQIAASRVKLSEYKIRQMYGDPTQVNVTYVDNYYKYRVGSYPQYEQAYNFKTTILQSMTIRKGSEKPFIVAFDRDGNQVEVTEDMKPAHLQGKD